MAKRSKGEPIQADASLEQAEKTSPALKEMMSEHGGGHGHAEQTLREDTYKGHQITIKTTYEITVDGKKFDIPLGVSNSGNVQYHGIPNVGFPSAVDLMRSVIDQFPEEFGKKGGRKGAAPANAGHPAHGEDGHDHDHEAAVAAEPKRARTKKVGR